MKKLIIILSLICHIHSTHAMDNSTQHNQVARCAHSAPESVEQPNSSMTQKFSWFEAVHSRNVAVVYAFLQGTQAVDERNETQATALHLALMNPEEAPPSSLIKILLNFEANPNLQDNLGNTPLHYAFKAHQHQEAALKRAMLVLNALEQEIEQNEIPSDMDIVTLRIAENEVTALKQRLLSHITPIVLLLSHEASACIPNSKAQVLNGSVLQMWPKALQELQGVTCENVIHWSQSPKVIAHCIRERMNPDIKRRGATLLAKAVEIKNHAAIFMLLTHGAQLTTPFARDENPDVVLNVVQIAAFKKDPELLKVVFESPQGVAPFFIQDTFEQCKNEIFSLMWCTKSCEAVSRLDDDVLYHICTFLVPDQQTLIHTTHLQDLHRYARLKAFGRNLYRTTALVDALTDRHIRDIGHMLKQPCILPAPFNRQLHEAVRLEGPVEQRVLGEPTAFSKLLDPALSPLEERRKDIKAQYAAFFK